MNKTRWRNEQITGSNKRLLDQRMLEKQIPFLPSSSGPSDRAPSQLEVQSDALRWDLEGIRCCKGSLGSCVLNL